jgi:hypothetical protein
MSGPLRRNKRSRPADAGEPLQEGLAAEPEGAAPTAETPSAARESGGEPVAETAAHSGSDEPAGRDAPGEDAGSDAAAQEPSAGATTPEPSAADESSRARMPQPSAPDESAGAATPEPSALDESAGAGTPATASEGTTSTIPAESATPPEGVPPASKSRRARWRPFRKAKRTQATGATPPAAPAPAPVLLADPNTPAGLDPADAPMRPPAGRRGRLRRRLRYLRRARELMLRDLGGLLYEVHRTGGGRVEAHATVVSAKVQRIAGLDAEAHALETALTAPRSEAVVFEPGVGGTCDACGELYGSDAHFCSNCGAPIGTAAPAAPAPETKAPEAGAEEPARRAFWRRAARAPEGAPETTSGETAVMSPTTGPAATADEAASHATPGGDDTAGATPDESAAPDPDAEVAASDDTAVATPDQNPAPPAGDTPAEDRPNTDERPNPAGDDPAAPRADAASAPPGEEPRNASSRTRNGRPEDYKPPGSSSADPLISRESRP